MAKEFTTEKLENVMKIICPPELDAEAATEFTNQSKAWLLNPVCQFVFDLKNVKTIERDFYKVMLQFKATLKRDEKSIYSLNLETSLQRQLVSDGVDQAFNPIASMNVLLEKNKPKGPGHNLNGAFINPFLSATQKTLEVQCNTKVKVLKPYVKKELLDGVAICGVIALSSNGFQGSIVLSFKEDVFLSIYQNMFDEKHDKLTPEIVDAAGELLNMIYGMAKTDLNTQGFDFQKALPTVLVGEKLSVRQSGIKPAVTIPFETTAGTFHLQIEFDIALGGQNV